MKPKELEPLSEPLQALTELFRRSGCRGMVIGGIAVGLLGTPRFTADVDAVVFVDVDALPHFLTLAADVGLVPRISDALAFARRHRVLLLRHKKSAVHVDVSLGLLPFEAEAIERGSMVQVGDLTFRIPTPEDLVVFKAVAHRPRDMEDIKAVVARHPDMDVVRVERWVRDFAEVLEMPELWEDIAPILQCFRALRSSVHGSEGSGRSPTEP